MGDPVADGLDGCHFQERHVGDAHVAAEVLDEVLAVLVVAEDFFDEGVKPLTVGALYAVGVAEAADDGEVAFEGFDLGLELGFALVAFSLQASGVLFVFLFGRGFGVWGVPVPPGFVFEALAGGGAEEGAVELLEVRRRGGAEFFVELPDGGALFQPPADVVVPKVGRVHHRQAERLFDDSPPSGDGGRETRLLRTAGEVALRPGLEFPQIGALGRLDGDLPRLAAPAAAAVFRLGDADAVAFQGDASPFHPQDFTDGHPGRQDEKEAQVHRGGVGDEILLQPLLLLRGEEDDGGLGAVFFRFLGPVRGGAFAPGGSEAEDAAKEGDHGADRARGHAFGELFLSEGLNLLRGDVRPLPEGRVNMVLEEQTVVRHATGRESAVVCLKPG